jgi:hypothetical protein
MTYLVFWSVAALQELVRVEQAAGNPQAVRDAANRIDFMLRRQPRDMGESRSPGFRVWYEDVLGVYYRLDEARMRVEILFAGPARRH